MEQHTWIGRSLNGRYKIDALLGQGGMSAVYKAMDPNLKRVVAIKLIHPHLSTDDDFIYRFKREAAAVAAFRHPNIVQVYDFNSDNDVYYMVLEFIPGETLQDRLKHLKKSNTHMPLNQAVKVILNLCDALGYAHKQGMIHRDIKPANVMLDIHGQAILMDFGIVKILDATTHTTTGAVLGTARYMSPEVIRSEMPDERSDLYSLGVTFYEMLSGDPPFDADSAMSLLMRHLNDPVPDLSTKRSDIPAELIRIVNKALEKDRNDRYRSANEMAGDLKRFLATLEAGPVSISLPTPKAEPSPAEPKKAAEKTPLQTEEQTEPWNISTPARPQTESSLERATKVNVPAQKADIKKPAPIEADAPQPEIPQAPGRATQSATKASIPPLVKYGALGIAAILCIAVAGFSLWRMTSQVTPDDKNSAATQTMDASVSLLNTAEQTADARGTESAQQTADAGLTASVAQPTDTSTDTPIPLTPTPTTPYVLITGIRIEDNKYIVDYEVHNFPESPSLHVHMFFNTVPPEQAGYPANGPWQLTWGRYGDPPFTKYGPANRPAQATQMCSLVANPDHSVKLNTGNCFDLPE